MTATPTGPEEGYNTDDEFERELANVSVGTGDSDSDSDGGWGTGAGGQQGRAWQPQDTDDDDDDDGDDDDDEGRYTSQGGGGGGNGGGLSSMATFRRRMAEQDTKLDFFQQSLLEIREAQEWAPIAPTEPWPAPGGSTTATAVSYELPALPGDGPAPQSSSEAVSQDFSPPPSLKHPEGVLQGGQEPGEGEGEDRFRVRREFEAAEGKRREQRAAERRLQEEEAVRHRAVAEEAAARQRADLQAQQARRLAELEAAAAGEAQRIEMELAAERAAASAAEAEDAERQAARQAAEAERRVQAEERGRLKAKRAQEVLDRQLAVARRSVAALKVWHRWRKYCSSGACGRRHASIIRLQALARGQAGRRAAKLERERRGTKAEMEAARASGDLDRLQRAVDKAKALGLGQAAKAELDAFDSAARAASGALLRAAQGGDASTFRKALLEARKYRKLGGLAGEAQATFGGRVSAALRKVKQAAQGGSLSRLRDLAKAASALGVPEEQLMAAEKKAVARDEAASLALDDALAASPLNLEQMKRCLEAAEGLGLVQAAKAARRRLAARQASTATELQEAAASASAADVEALAAEAEALGLRDSVAQARGKLFRRQEAAEAALQAAALHASITDFRAAESEARGLALQPDVLTQHLVRFEARQMEAYEAFTSAAAFGSVAEFSSASEDARDLGLSAELSKAAKVMAARTAEVVSRLSECVDIARRAIAPSLLPGWGACSSSNIVRPGDLAMPYSGWKDFLATGAGGADLPELVRTTVDRCDGLGLSSWTSLAWRAVCIQSAAAHAGSRGLLSTLWMSVDHWGAPQGRLTSEPGAEAQGLGDAVAALAIAHQQASPWAVGRARLLWPQPCDVSGCEAERRKWKAGRWTAEASSRWVPPAEPGPEPGPADASSAIGGSVLSKAMLEANSPGVALTELRALDLSLEGLASLGRLGALCPALTSLNANVNCVRDLSGLSGCSSLTDLQLRENAVSDLSGQLEALSSLRRLQMDANRLRSLRGVALCTELRSLSLADNAISHIAPLDVAGLHSLALLGLSGNRIPSLGGVLSHLTALQHLDVCANGLAALGGLEACPLLLTLRASSNLIEAFPELCNSPLLQQLHLDENRLTEVPHLPWLPHLTALNLQDNHITALSPLGCLPRLSDMNLSFNRLQDSSAIITTLISARSLARLQVSDNPGTGTPSFRQALLQQMLWLEELNHDDVEPQAAASAAARALAAAPTAVPLMLRAAMAANRPLVRSDRIQTLGAVRDALQSRGPWQLLAMGDQALRRGEPTPADADGWLSAVEARWSHTTAVCLAEKQAAQLGGPREAWSASEATKLQNDDSVHSLLAGHLHEAKSVPMAKHQGVFRLRPEYEQRIQGVRSAAATVLQARWRGVLGCRLRARLARERSDQRLQRAASAVQGLWRGHCYRHSDDLQERRDLLAERRAHQLRLAAEAEAAAADRQQWARLQAAVAIQAMARGRKVRRRMAHAIAASKYVDNMDDSFDFEEELDLDFIKPPPGMDLDDSPITPDLLAGWGGGTPLPSGPLATSAGIKAVVGPGGRAPETEALPMRSLQGQAEAHNSPCYNSEALERRRLSSSSGGGLRPSLSQRVMEVDTSPGSPRVWHNPRPGHDQLGESQEDPAAVLLSPTKSVAESSSNMSYGSNMRDEERRAKLKAKMEKVADEWGFENSSTAEAFYKAQQKRLKAQKKKNAASKYTDPTKRLEKLNKQVEGRAQLHPSMFHKDPHANTSTLRPQRGVVDGPQSRESKRPPRPAQEVSASQERKAQVPYRGRPHPPTTTTIMPVLRRANSDISSQFGDLEMQEYRMEQQLGTPSSDPGWREFQTSEPNRKLIRQKAGATGSPKGQKIGNWHLSPPPAARAWGGTLEDFGDLDVSGRAVAGPRKERLPAGAPKPLNSMQILQ